MFRNDDKGFALQGRQTRSEYVDVLKNIRSTILSIGACIYDQFVKLASWNFGQSKGILIGYVPVTGGIRVAEAFRGSHTMHLCHSLRI